LFQVQQVCSQTVSLWRALIFGADGACVSITMATMAVGLGLFVAGVVLVQYVASRLLFGNRPASEAATPEAAPRMLAGQVMSKTRRPGA